MRCSLAQSVSQRCDCVLCRTSRNRRNAHIFQKCNLTTACHAVHHWTNKTPLHAAILPVHWHSKLQQVLATPSGNITHSWLGITSKYCNMICCLIQQKQCPMQMTPCLTIISNVESSARRSATGRHQTPSRRKHCSLNFRPINFPLSYLILQSANICWVSTSVGSSTGMPTTSRSLHCTARPPLCTAQPRPRVG